MPHPDVVVIGGSAGSLEVLSRILAELPSSFPACVLVVLHTRADASGVLPRILSRTTALRVQHAETDLPLKHGHVYVAKPDCHLLVEGDRMLVTHGPRENGFRPAIDPLFRTAARSLGSRAIGVILSGALDDGTYGLGLVKHHGGIAVVQDPEEAAVPSMPASAIRRVAVDHVVPAAQIAGQLLRLISNGYPAHETMAEDQEPEPQLASDQTEVRDMEGLFGAPSSLTCPNCGGALWELADDDLVRYRCHVGHQFAQDSLAAEQRDAVEGALWSAVRVLEEHAELKLRMARRAEAAGLPVVSEGFAEGARNSHQQAQQIRALLFSGGLEPSSLEAEVSAPVAAKGTRKGKRNGR